MNAGSDWPSSRALATRRVYENTREPNWEGIRESNALRGIRTGLVPCLGRRWQTARTSNRFFRQNAWLAASLLQGRILRNFRFGTIRVFWWIASWLFPYLFFV